MALPAPFSLSFPGEQLSFSLDDVTGFPIFPDTHMQIFPLGVYTEGPDSSATFMFLCDNLEVLCKVTFRINLSAGFKL